MAIPPGPYRTLVRQLARRRARRRVSQTDLDVLAGWATGLAAKFECGMRYPSPFFLTVWCDALGADLVIQPRHEPVALGEAGEQLAFAFTFPDPPPDKRFARLPVLIPKPRPPRPPSAKGRRKRRRKGRRSKQQDHLRLAA